MLLSTVPKDKGIDKVIYIFKLKHPMGKMELHQHNLDVPKKNGLPIIGQYFRFKSSPLDFFEYLFDQTSDMIQFQIGPMKPYLICNPKIVKEVLTNRKGSFGKFTTGVNVATGDTVRSTKSGKKRQDQHIAISAFSKKAFRSYIPKIIDNIDALELYHPYVSTDMIIKGFTLKNLFDIIFNYDISDRIDEILETLDESLDLIFDRFTSILSLPLFIPTPSNQKIKSAIALANELTEDVITQHLDNPKGLMSKLFDKYHINDLHSKNIEQIKVEIMTLIFAGFKTTSFVLNTLLYHVAKYVDVQDKIRSEISEIPENLAIYQQLDRMRYTRQVIEEILRLYPPVWVILRRVEENIQIRGYQFQQGDLVLLSPYLLQRHESYWQFPQEFIPERFEITKRVKYLKYQYIPFGGGAYKCVGRHFAIQQILLFLHKLIPRFRVELIPDTQFEYTASISLQLSEPLNLKFEQRSI